MEKALLAAYTPPLRNKVRQPAGFPTPFGVGLPGLILCRGQVRPQSECRLGKGFALPLAPNPVRRAAALPTPTGRFGGGRRPAPLPPTRSNPSVRCGGQLPLRRGAGATPQSRCGVTAPFFAPKRPFGTFRCFAWLIRIKEHTVLFYAKRSRFSRGAACARGSRRKPSVTLRRDSSPYTGEPEQPLSHAAADSSPYTGEPKNDLQLRSGREGGAEETLVLIKGRGFSAGFRGRGACGGGLRWRGRRRARSW